MTPLVWREGFPKDIALDVVSEDNPEGGITNSDLKLAAEVLAIGVILDQAPGIKHASLGTLCDNTPTVSLVEKMASKTKTPTSGQLLRGLAVMLHCRHAGWLTTVHVPGPDNVMADFASRPSKAQNFFILRPHFLTPPFALPLTIHSHCREISRGRLRGPRNG
jgi:hypothetical protein